MSSCPLCGAHAAGRLESRREGGTDYTLYACSACGVQFWEPLKNPGGAWYAHDERYADRNADPILTPNKKHRDVLDFLGSKKGRVLDVGCGVGNFLALARSRGWECWGIDFDPDAVAAGKKTFGLANLSVASLQEFAAAHPDLRFDLISFFDVFEHLDNHNDFLELVKGMLAPGGRIALSVPYRHCLRWLIPADLPPRHLTRWDERSLEHTLARHGFAVAFTRRLPASVYFIALKFRFRYGKWASFGLVKKAKQAATASGTLGAKTSGRVSAVHALAKTKDLVLFGVPALALWLVLLPSRKRYTDLTVVAALSS